MYATTLFSVKYCLDTLSKWLLRKGPNYNIPNSNISEKTFEKAIGKSKSVIKCTGYIKYEKNYLLKSSLPLGSKLFLLFTKR